METWAVPGARIDIVLNDVAGDAIGSLAVPRTAGDKAWSTASTPIRKVTSVHNVILRFYASSQENLMTLDKVMFGADRE